MSKSQSTDGPRTSATNKSLTIILAVGFVLIGLWLQSREKANQPNVVKQPNVAERPTKPDVKSPTLIPNVSVRDQDGRVIFQGTVDLAETLRRIDAHRTLRQFSHDGTVFQNRERELPRQPAGYYREYVHPTPNTSGPGPQRVVTGKEGEAYYTHDHYHTFIQIR